MNRRYQTLADYVAIGLAPLLICWMLNSLAGFLMLVLYQGNYPQRVMWTLFWYTMGATALARVTIEESRSYSSVYAVALGVATFVVMLRFLGNPIFSAAVIMTVGYLADRIVHDCTIVDDGVDSSGRGLVDSAKKWLGKLRGRTQRKRTIATDSAPTDRDSRDTQRDALHGHQPGRTVLYLALGALPLFGIGQFFLRGNPGSWETARWQLASYLFASLSLLVVTSFLNLRRYLRQRNTEMPTQVTAAWLAGGIGLIVVILVLAILAPMPGRAIVSFEMPDFLTNTSPTTASKYGWGNEGADQPGSGGKAQGAPRPDSSQPSDAPELPSVSKPGAQPGGDSGKRDDGPAGKESGGKKPSEKSNDDSGKTKSDGSKPQGEGEGSKKQGESKQPSQKQGEQAQGKQAQSKQAQSKQTQSQQKQSQQSAEEQSSGSPQQDTPEQKSNQQQRDSPNRDTQKSNEPESQPGKSDDSQNESDREDQTRSDDPPSDAGERSSEKSSSEEDTDNNPQPDKRRQNQAANTEPPPAQTPPAAPSPPTDWSGLLSGFAGLIKFLIIVGLLALIAVYAYLNRHAFLEWLNSWSAGSDDETIEPVARASAPKPSRSLRPFSSFKNPVGNTDPGQVVVVTFQALEAWGREQGVTRNDDETPSEYTRRLVAEFPNLRQSAIQVVDAYNRVVYGRAKAGRDDVTAASSVWQVMRPQL
ncbi:MAG: DUF4129 domain-containing protein [Rhodopirellula sp. JB053]